MILATVFGETFDHRRLFVDVADNAVDNVVNAISNTGLQRRNIHQLRSLYRKYTRKMYSLCSKTRKSQSFRDFRIHHIQAYFETCAFYGIGLLIYSLCTQYRQDTHITI